MVNPALKQLQNTMDSVIKGKSDAVKMAIVTLLGRGNLLIEGVPGVGKTTLAFALAKATDCSFHRIQFTSDLMPTDIIGVSIYNPEKREFEFKPGPIFSNIVLADEINRTNPKTQSALLEAMNEKKVSVERRTFILPEPFMVLATQNPIEFHGTFPLPESQLDRFMMHIKLGYAAPEHERLAVREQTSFDLLDKLAHVVTKAEIVRMQAAADRVAVEDSILDYLMTIVTETRRHEKIRLGVSTRGAQFFLKAARAHAYYEGRDYVIPDDIKILAPLVLGHRLILKTKKFISDAEMIINELLDTVPVPV
ncbi:MAG: MoxR family ATPase [Nitrospiraceae bacterium]|jgi:MoxR-like ATPase|nr:MAG: MoxR family ATPase [Nitrospiraceae bacterium]